MSSTSNSPGGEVRYIHRARVTTADSAAGGEGYGKCCDGGVAPQRWGAKTEQINED